MVIPWAELKSQGSILLGFLHDETKSKFLPLEGLGIQEALWVLEQKSQVR